MATTGPVFGKPPPRSIQTDGSANAFAKPSSSTSKRGTTESKLKVVQYEIAEKEAVKIIKSVCEDAANVSNVPFNAEDIQDIMSGVLILGNLCKRICFEKQIVEDRMTRRIEEFAGMARKKDESIDQLEKVILTLQAENLRAGDHIAELNLKYGHQITVFSNEIHGLRETMQDYRSENERLQSKLSSREKKLMNIPRMEEQYMRNARSTIRQSELANTMNKIEWKKMEEELKNLQFWKNKAKQQSEIAQKLREEIESLQQQNRTILSKHQSLLRNASASGLPSHGQHDLSAKLAAVTATAVSSDRQRSHHVKRPGSAPATVAARQHPVDSFSASMKANGSTPALDVSFEEAAAAAAGGSNRPASSPMGRKSSTVSIAVQFNQEDATEEIMKLRAEVGKRDITIMKLGQRLSLARAYPLLSVRDGSFEAGEVGLTKIETERLRNEQLTNSRTLLSGDLTGVDYMDDEMGSQTSSFMAEEETLQEARVQKAITLQLEYNERVMSRRDKDSPHLAAIRRSKSFAKVIEDLAKEEQEEYMYK